MKISLKGKKAVVCGSSQGIGFGAAIQLANAGADITLVARNELSLEDAKNKLPVDQGQEHQIVVADFSQINSLETAFSIYLGNNKEIDILINNTGGPPPGLAVDGRIEEYELAFSQHLLCNQFLVQSVVPSMKNTGFGRIINVLSTSVKSPIAGLGVSNTIRGAVASWSKTLSAELGPFGITVNNILPGFIKTGRLDALIANRAEQGNITIEEQESLMKASIPAQRFGDISEIGKAIVFLASIEAGYINGINLTIDGGKTNVL